MNNGQQENDHLREILCAFDHHDFQLYIDRIEPVHIQVDVQLDQVMAFDIFDYSNPMLLSI